MNRNILATALVAVCSYSNAAETIQVGVFDVDASPPVGSPMAYDPVKAVTTPLRCTGIVITGDEKPIVMCAVDWIGIGNDGQAIFKERLAAAAETDPDRVAVHTLHQHDAPRCDFSADHLLAEHELSGVGFDPGFSRDVISRTATAVGKAIQNAQPVTHIGVGQGRVEMVASNRRILGDDGKVLHTRFTATRDPNVRAFPAGTIDSQMKLISLWHGDKPIVAITWYATHPQSYYRTGLANPDFPGMARNARQAETGVPHIHFNGAGGNIGAGKWNDGAKANRQVLADRVAAGMKRAWDNIERSPVGSGDLAWTTVPVALPAASHLQEASLLERLQDTKLKPQDRFAAATNLAWLRRCAAGDTISVACLRLGRTRVLHLPGELFIEYQINAQKLRPDLFVAMAAYGDYGPGYIGTEVAYRQGGYETSPRASRVAPQVEGVLMKAISRLLDAEQLE